MKKFTAIISTLALATTLTACSNTEPTSSDNQSSSQNSTSSQQSSSSQQPTPSSSQQPTPSSSQQSTSSSSQQSTPSSSQGSSSDDPYIPLTERDYELKGEELIAKFKWPYDAPIELEGMTAKKVTTTADKGDVYNDIDISELSHEIDWWVTCDYGYLATAPESGDNFEYKKYKKDDKIGDFTVTGITTVFGKFDGLPEYDYFQGVTASFDGEITLTGELSITLEDEDFLRLGEIVFYPDEESCKKLPIVNFEPLLNPEYYFEPDVYDVWIRLGDEVDYPEIDFTGIPTHDTHVKAKVKIKNYSYDMRCIPGLQYCGYASIADGELEIL